MDSDVGDTCGSRGGGGGSVYGGSRDTLDRGGGQGDAGHLAGGLGGGESCCPLVLGQTSSSVDDPHGEDSMQSLNLHMRLRAPTT